MEGTHEVGWRPFMPASTLSGRSVALLRVRLDDCTPSEGQLISHGNCARSQNKIGRIPVPKRLSTSLLLKSCYHQKFNSHEYTFGIPAGFRPRVDFARDRSAVFRPWLSARTEASIG